MVNKYKVGDSNSAAGKSNHYGKIATIKEVNTWRDYCYTIDLDNERWVWRESEFEPVNEQKIVITTDGKITTAKLYEGSKVIKTAEAKCNPEDTFDFNVGARLAFDRLSVKYKKGDKVKIVKNTCNHFSKIGNIITLTDIWRIDGNEVKWNYKESCGYITEDDVEPYVESETTDGWRVVNRPAKKGDYIRLVTKVFTFDKIGDILKVYSVDGCVQVADRDCPHRTGEYDPDYLWNYAKYQYEVVERVYKPGDKVKIVGNTCYHGYATGDIVTIDEIFKASTFPNETCWRTKEKGYFIRECDVEPCSYKPGDKVEIIGNCCSHSVAIGKVVTLKNKCNEYCGDNTDAWDIEGYYCYVCERDFKPYTEPPKPKYYNGKVVCIETEDKYFTVGKVYEFVDGIVKDNDNDERPTRVMRKVYNPIVDITDDKWIKQKGLKFIPFVES